MNPTLPPLTREETVRYSRHLCLPQVGRVGQRRLKAARVLIVGLGGLGSPAALYLAAAGVGTLGLVEFDKVETHNLQRQILYPCAAVGQSKLASAATQLTALNPHCKLNLHPQRLHADNVLERLAAYDLILDGSDNFPTRYLINDAAYLTHKPLVHGSLSGFEGQVSFFHPMRRQSPSPCYRCVFPEMPPPGAVPNCAEAGVFGALCGVVGSLQAMEAIKYLIGIGETLEQRLLAIDALTLRFRLLNIKKDPNCPLCRQQPQIKDLQPSRYQYSCTVATADSILEINPCQAQAQLQSDHPPLLLDVREPFENELCALDNSLLIPTGQLADQLDKLPKDRPLLVYCHYGQRSITSVRWLRSKGYEQAVSLAGGIDAWAQQIDPTLPRY